jgi:hypothetical protein
VEQERTSVDETVNRELRGLPDVPEGQRFPLDRSRAGISGKHDLDGPSFDKKHQYRSAKEDDAEGGHERDERHRFGHERVRDRRENLPQAALQQVGQVGSEQHRDKNGGTDDRHGQKDLKRRLCGELDNDSGPVRGCQQRTPLEQQLRGQINFTIAPVYPVSRRFL